MSVQQGSMNPPTNERQNPVNDRLPPPPPPPAGWSLQQYQPAPPQPAGNGMAVASMVLGILSVVFCFAGLATLAMVVLAIVFGAARLHQSGMAVAGFILGFVGAVIYLIVGIASAGVLFLI